MLRRVLCFVSGLTALLTACGSRAPASTPLSGEVSHPAPRKSSSRAEEGGGGDTRVDAPPPAEVDVDVEDPGDDSVGSALDCRRLAEGPGEACLGATLAMRVCETWGPLLEPDVAEAWMSCISGADPTSVRASCQTSRITACAFSAIARVRTDGAQGAVCEEVARECEEVAPELTRTACERAIAAFRPDARPKITECLQHGCRTGAFGSCIP